MQPDDEITVDSTDFHHDLGGEKCPLIFSQDSSIYPCLPVPMSPGGVGGRTGQSQIDVCGFHIDESEQESI